MNRNFGRIATVLGMVIITSAVQWNTAHATLEQEERLAAQRLMKMSAVLIERAHDIKDDLMIQGIMRALGDSPGMLFACVTDGENHIVAHSQPSRLGRTLIFDANIPGTWSCLLQEGNRPWGRLVFRISRSSFMSAYILFLLVVIFAALVLMGIFLFANAQWQALLSQREREKIELKALLDEETKKASAAEERQRVAYQQNLVWLQDALDQIPNAILLLNDRQRIVTVNQKAAAILSISGPGDLMGASWQDVPYLRDSGQLLAESIEKPGKTIRSSSSDSRDTHSFITTKREDLSNGTWVTFFESKELVK
jgi:PAS domain-containing protein